jgi:hypothetical protein
MWDTSATGFILVVAKMASFHTLENMEDIVYCR